MTLIQLTRVLHTLHSLAGPENIDQSEDSIHVIDQSEASTLMLLTNEKYLPVELEAVQEPLLAVRMRHEPRRDHPHLDHQEVLQTVLTNERRVSRVLTNERRVLKGY